MRVLGIDPGIARLGWGVVVESGSKQEAVAYGCLITKKGKSDQQRLSFLFQELKKLIKKYRPEVVAVEELFFATNAKTAIQVGQARGVAILSAALACLPVVSYSPLRIKMAITGYGKAEKGQVQRMVEAILKLKTKPEVDDTADALAVALTHCFLNKFEKAVKKYD